VESSAFGFTKLWAQCLYRVVVGFCTVPYWFLSYFLFGFERKRKTEQPRISIFGGSINAKDYL